jgi:hypothetical protein
MLGKAAVVIWFDVAAAMRAELEDWHTREHMPERLGIPGFLRGSRWIANAGSPSYFVLYEAKGVGVLKTGAYLKRLNHPTPWSRKMMPHHVNMVRSVCRVRASFGGGISSVMGTLRLSSPPRIKNVSDQKGLTSAHLLKSEPMPRTPQTTEQKIRGGDAQADWVVLIGGHDASAVESALRQLRTPDAVGGLYRLSHSLSAKE